MFLPPYLIWGANLVIQGCPTGGYFRVLLPSTLLLFWCCCHLQASAPSSNFHFLPQPTGLREPTAKGVVWTGGHQHSGEAYATCQEGAYCIACGLQLLSSWDSLLTMGMWALSKFHSSPQIQLTTIKLARRQWRPTWPSRICSWK